MVTVNSYDISEIDWNPVDFKVIGDQFNLKKTPVTFGNGMKFNIYPFLTDINDIAFNNKSGIILSNLQNNIDIIEDKNSPSNTSELKSFKTILGIVDEKGSFKHYETVSGKLGLKLTESDFSITDELIFNFIENQIYIEDYYGQILTNFGSGYGVDGTGNDLIYFVPKNKPITNSQKWDYFLNEEEGLIILFANGTSYTNVLVLNHYGNLELNQFDTTFQYRNVPNNSLLKLKSYKNTNVSNDCVADSFIVQYAVSPILNELSAINPNLNYKQNYIGIFPYENINSDNTYNFYFHGLKNYQTTEYNYTVGYNNSINRIYYKIHAGTNQEKGLDKLYLTYQTDTINVSFPPNEETNFYISPTIDRIYLNDGVYDSKPVAFTLDGARASNCPYTSDRITISNKTNFNEIKNYSKYVTSYNNSDLKYLCTWLYFDKIRNQKVWLDRYYNSAYYSNDTSGYRHASHMSYEDLLYARVDLPVPDEELPFTQGGLVYDEISYIELKPGILYQYYHCGNKDSRDYIIDLNYKKTDVNNFIPGPGSWYNTSVEYCNVLNLTSWDSSNLKDESYYNNNGLTFGNSGNFHGDYWSLDGSNYAIFQASDVLLQSNALTVSIWLSVDDWANINGYQIFGNYYNSGFGFINDSKTTAPILTILNNDTYKVYNFNCNLGQISETKSQIHGDLVQRLSDMSYWIFDSKNPNAIKNDVDNSLIFGPIGLALSQIDQIETDSDENLYIYDNLSKKYVKMTKNGDILGIFSVPEYINRIEIDLYNRVIDGNPNFFNTPRVGIYGNCSVVDNNNSIWQVIGPNLYKDNNIITTVGASNQITCDMYNNIWIISENDEYTKLKSNGEVVFRYKFNKNNLPIDDNCPPQPPIYELDVVTDLDEDLPFLSKEDRKTYILTLDDYKKILVTPPKKPPKIKKQPDKTRIRAINFINTPVKIKDNTELTNICGLSAIETDNLVMVDRQDKQAYIINQLGQPVIKLNLENLLLENETANFVTGGDFTGYQNIRKYKKKMPSNLAWKFQIKDTAEFNSTIESKSLGLDVSQLSRGWHNFTFVFNPAAEEACYYIDSYPVPEGKIIIPTTAQIEYVYRTSLLLGTTTVKNTILNNFLNLTNGYRFIGSVGDLKMYSIALNEFDVEQLYYSSPFAPKLKTLNWNMPIGKRNYIEEITEWFQFQLPTNKSKYYNINIHNLNIDESLKNNIELAIQNIIGKLSPAHTVLNKINWMIPSKKTSQIRSSIPLITELCPNRLTVIQICNSNSIIDDNFSVVLNGVNIGQAILDQNLLIGSYFIGTDNMDINYTLENSDFYCPINLMQKYTFLESIISKTVTNELQLINIKNNGRGNLGKVQIRSYLKTADNKLIDPAVITDLSYSGDSGESFTFNFNYVCP
jgi:hypothetical protein